MGGCLGKSSYGPWRHARLPSDNNENSRKKKRNELQITIGEGRSTGTKISKGSDDNISSNSNSEENPKISNIVDDPMVPDIGSVALNKGDDSEINKGEAK